MSGIPPQRYKEFANSHAKSTILQDGGVAGGVISNDLGELLTLVADVPATCLTRTRHELEEIPIQEMTAECAIKALAQGMNNDEQRRVTSFVPVVRRSACVRSACVRSACTEMKTLHPATDCNRKRLEDHRAGNPADLLCGLFGS